MKFNVVGKYDVVILGSGISALLCALELAKHEKSICIITKEAVTESSSRYAQGGIAVPLAEGDSVEKHLNDTLLAGTKLCNETVAKGILNHSVSAFKKLESYGVKFDLTSDKNIHQTKEAAHSVSRVCHIGGDASGRFITKALIDRVCREPRILISQGSVALNIFRLENCKNSFGILIGDVTRDNYVILAKNIIVATGGFCQIYETTTNPKVITGDGIAMAHFLGAEIQDIEMIQFHPTVLIDNGAPSLITEAIRGEGGRLKNSQGEYFAYRYHERAELAPRDVLSRAILSEMQKTKSDRVYLDLRNLGENYFMSRFPSIYQTCLERKIDLFKKGIPVIPAAHYSIGGIKCDLSGRTSIPGLWAIGEAASNGFHGANRLASNSLLECIVVPDFLVNELLATKEESFLNLSDVCLDIDEVNYRESEIESFIKELQSRNLKNIGLIRTEVKLKEHLDWLNKSSEIYNVELTSFNCQVQELKNMLLLSTLICNAALERKHSLGVHNRDDYQLLPVEFLHSVYSSKQLKWEPNSVQKQLVAFLEVGL